jgi:hypothetical protein
VAGCGFIAAGAKPIRKPDSFVLIGHADVALPASDQRATGVACQAPAGVPGVAKDTPVRVLNPAGATVARGVLGPGVVGHLGDVASCNFPFEIPGVPGGSTTYGVVIGSRPAQTFPAATLRQNAPAVITIAP